jgi:hypothetical protein
MSTTYQWILQCNWDILPASDPTATTGIPTRVRAAFNLNSVGWKGIAPSGTLNSDIDLPVLCPWKVPSTGVTHPMLAEDFLAIEILPSVTPVPPDLPRVQPITAITNALTLVRLPWPTPQPGFLSSADGLFGEMSNYHQNITSNLVQEITTSIGENPGESDGSKWSDQLAGASQQGYPSAHALGLAVWLEDQAGNTWPTGAGTPWIIVVPEKLLGRSIDQILAGAAVAGENIVPVEVRYKSADPQTPDIHLRVNAMQLRTRADVALIESTIGIKQTVDASSFVNWLGTLHDKIGRFTDLIWLRNQIPLENIKPAFDTKKINICQEMTLGFISEPGAREKAAGAFAALRRRLVDKNWTPEPDSPAMAFNDPFNFFGIYHKIGEEWLDPVLVLLRRLVVPFPPANNIRDSLAFEVLTAVAVHWSASNSNTVADDVEISLQNLASAPVQTSVLVPKPDPLTNEPEMMLWTRKVLWRALKDVDSNGQGGSHTGKYEELFKLLEIQIGMETPGYVISQLTGTVDSVDYALEFEALLSKALEQISLLTDDEEVLKRMFCLEWDDIFARMNDTDRAVWEGLLGKTETSGGEKHILYPRALDQITNYIQKVNSQLSFSRRHGTVLAHTVWDQLETLLEKEQGQVILGLMADFASVRYNAAESVKDKVTLSPHPAVWALLQNPVPVDLSILTGWQPLIDKYYLALLVRCAVLLEQNLPMLQGLDATMLGSLRAQLFLAAAYLGKMHLALLAPALFTTPPIAPPPVTLDSTLVEKIAQLLCGDTGTLVGNETPWREMPWTRALTGLSSQKQKVSTPPVLPVPLITVTGEFDPRRYLGVLIRARRRLTSTPGTDKGWMVNVGDPVFLVDKPLMHTPGTSTSKPNLEEQIAEVLKDEVTMGWLDDIGERPVANGTVAPAPWQVTEQNGIAQAFVEYRGKAANVRLWDDAQDDPALNHETQNGANAPLPRISNRLVKYHIVSNSSATQYGEWGPVPAVLYGSNWAYDFQFIPVHNTGALPFGWHQSGLPGNLVTRPNTPAFGDSIITVQNYLRRVPVSQVRLAILVSQNSGNVWKREYDDLTEPLIDRGVRPLCVDLVDKQTRERVDSLTLLDQKTNKAKPAAVATPAQIFLLRREEPGNSPKVPVHEASFVIRPPCTAVENWSIWQRTLFQAANLTGADLLNACDCVGDTERMVRELLREKKDSEVLQKAQGLEATQLLDDPAVEGVLVEVVMLLDLRHDVPQAVQGTAIYLPFEHMDLKTYAASSDDPDLLPRTNVLDLPTRMACRDIVQTHAREKITVKWAEHTVPPSLAKVGSEVHITVPGGSVVEVRLTPCIRNEKTATTKIWGIYESTELIDVDPALVGSGVNMVSVLPAMCRVWVESVPNGWDETAEHYPDIDGQVPAPYLPGNEEVWSALRLAPVGTWTREARQIQRLEAAVFPQFAQPATATGAPHAQLRRWCFVSEVFVDVQPWVWRGLPEGPVLDEPAPDVLKSKDQLSALLWPDLPIQATQDRDREPKVLRRLVIGEAPAFGEREDAAAQERSGLVNYASIFLRMQENDPGVEPTPFVIYQDRGEQDDVARYFRVKLRVKSRYAGFQKVDVVDHDREVASELRWIWPGESPSQPKRETRHRRILFRGLRRQPLDLPRVKLVIPLLEALPGTQSETARPGFIAVLRETLRSPWHRLVGHVEWARVNLSDDESEVIKERPEFAPDALTSSQAFNMAFQSISNLKDQTRMHGQAFGLTYEREASDPLFPNAGFYFDAPLLNVTNGDGKGHNWFARMRFGWEIAPPYVMDNTPAMLASELTQSWQIQLLAPFQWLTFNMDKSVNLAHTTFSYDLTEDDRQATVTFRKYPDQVSYEKRDRRGMTYPGVPKPAPMDKNTQNPKASPSSILMLVLWSLVPDFLTAEQSKVAHSIFITLDGQPQMKEIYRNEVVKVPAKTKAASGPRPQLKPDGGNLILMFGRHEDVEDFLKKVKTISGKPNGIAMLDLVNEYLFRGTGDSDPHHAGLDSKLMVTRNSRPIFVD